MATVAGTSSNLTFTAEGAVSISYNTLVNAPLSLTPAIGTSQRVMLPVQLEL